MSPISLFSEFFYPFSSFSLLLWAIPQYTIHVLGTLWLAQGPINRLMDEF
jgi:hypothetical protein